MPESLKTSPKPNGQKNDTQKNLLLLKPRGFCAGVVRAIDIVRIALEAFGPPIYVRKEIVHNRFVVEELQGKGAIFVDSVDEVPEGERVIYSAHGVSPEVRQASKERRLARDRRHLSRWSPRSTSKPSSSPRKAIR